MLSKLKDIKIPSETPFINDALNLESIAENLSKLIQSTTEPFVFSINSPWGGGKTTFIKMWMQSLKNQGYPTFYFNAWKTDYSDIPLISFIGGIRSYIETEESSGEKNKREVYQKAKTISSNLGKSIAPILLKYITRNALDVEAIKAIVDLDDKTIDDLSKDISKFTENRLSQYKEQKEGIEVFKKQLEEIATNLISLDDGQGPFIIFVDELDRCRPSYALELLENIKHLFSVPNIVFVLGIDSGQLQHMVKSLYGAEFGAEGYLKRFIDLEFTLPKPHLNPDEQRNAFTLHLYNKFQLSEVIQRNDGLIIIEISSDLSNMFNFSLRDQIQCFTQINLAYRTVEIDHRYAFYLIFLIYLKAKNRTLYYRLNDKMTTTKEIFEFLLKYGEESVLTPEDNKMWTIIEAIIVIHLNKESINEYVKDQVGSGTISERSRRLQDLLNSGILSDLKHIQRQMFGNVEFTSKFTF